MSDQNRYVVKWESYVYADNDYMARKIAHGIKRNITGGDHAKVIEISEMPFASLQSRELEDISEPMPKDSYYNSLKIEEDELPF